MVGDLHGHASTLGNLDGLGGGPEDRRALATDVREVEGVVDVQRFGEADQLLRLGVVARRRHQA